jgi:hypothetical protein
MSGSHLSDAARHAGPTWQCAVAAWLPCAVPLQRVKSAVGTARRRPDNAVPTAPPPLSELPHTAHPNSARPDRAVARSEVDRRCPSAPTAATVVSTSTVSVVRALLSPFFVRGASSSPSPPSSPSQDRRWPP